MTSATRYRLFAAVTPGLEGLLEAELGRLLPGTSARVMSGGVEVRAAREELWRVACYSRLSESLRVRVGRFEAASFEALIAGLRRVPWHAWLGRAAQPVVKVATKRSALYHRGAVEERVRGVLAERLGAPESGGSEFDGGGGGGDAGRGEGGAGWPTVFLRLRRDEVTVSVDASGELLHRRGYRTHVGKAPLRETLAAACVAQAGLAPGGLVVDPFCGSGTLVIEALLADAGAPAALGRRFAFEQWPTHDAEAFRSWVAAQPEPARGTRRAVASDLDPDEVAAARANAERAGVAERITWGVADVAEALGGAPSPAAVLSNLPYGHRTRGGAALEGTLARFGAALRARAELAPVLVLSGAEGLEAATGVAWQRELGFGNRGLSVGLFRLERDGVD